MRKLWIGIAIITMLGIGIKVTFAVDVTVDSIIKKIQENTAGINDMKLEILTTTYSEAQLGTLVHLAKCYHKKPDKFKVETFVPVKQTILIVGDKMTMKTADGNLRTINPKQMPPIDVNQHFGPPIINILQNYNVTLNTNLSDETNNLYVLEFIIKNPPLVASSERVSNVPFKIEMFIDYNRKMIIKYKFYSQNNVVFMINEVKQIIQIGETHIPVVTQSIVFLPNGEKKRLETRFENVQINTGIPDKEFEVGQ